MDITNEQLDGLILFAIMLSFITVAGVVSLILCELHKRWKEGEPARRDIRRMNNRRKRLKAFKTWR